MAKKKKKVAAPVTGDDFVVRVIRSEKRFGVKKAQAASQVIKGHGVRTSVDTATMSMFLIFPTFSVWEEVMRQINTDLRKIGLMFVKSRKVPTAWEWQHYVLPAERKKEEASDEAV